MSHSATYYAQHGQAGVPLAEVVTDGAQRQALAGQACDGMSRAGCADLPPQA